MTVLPSPDLQALREQILHLAESQRAELVSALLDSMRPPSAHTDEAALAQAICDRADTYRRGELGAIDLDQSVKLAREALHKRRAT